MLFINSILLPSFASLSASLFSMILVCALTLFMVVVAVQFLNMFIIDANIFLFGWLFCCIGCFIWVLMR